MVRHMGPTLSRQRFLANTINYRSYHTTSRKGRDARRTLLSHARVRACCQVVRLQALINLSSLRLPAGGSFGSTAMPARCHP